MKTQKIIQKLQRPKKGQFVAEVHGKIVAHAKTFGGLLQALKQKGIEYGTRHDIVISHQPPKGAICVY